MQIHATLLETQKFKLYMCYYFHPNSSWNKIISNLNTWFYFYVLFRLFFLLFMQLLVDYFVGSMISGAGKGPLEKAKPSDWADIADRFQQAALDSRFGIHMGLMRFMVTTDSMVPLYFLTILALEPQGYFHL